MMKDEVREEGEKGSRSENHERMKQDMMHMCIAGHERMKQDCTCVYCWS